jgi:GT2 family glycosyltransferase
MDLSIVVNTCSMTRYDHIIKLLCRIKEQTHKDIETIIVVDQNGVLYEKIKVFIDSTFPDDHSIKLIHNPRNMGLSHGRNIGIANASGKIIVFTDDDAFPDSHWLEEIATTFDEDENIGGVVGEVIPYWEKNGMEWFPRELYWMISCSYVLTPTEKQEVERGFGVNMAFRKSLIVQTGMFDMNFGIKNGRWIGGDDTNMFLKIKGSGNKIIYNPSAIVHHSIEANRIRLKAIARRAFNGGYSVSLLKKIKQYRMVNSTENGYLRLLLFRFYPEMLKDLVLRRSGVPFKKMTYVTTAIVFEGLGYAYGLLAYVDIKNDNKAKLANMYKQGYVDIVDLPDAISY